GIEFKQKIDVLALLTVGSDGPRPRMPRVEVRSFGVVRQGALSHRAVINNISQGGVSAQCNADLEVGGEVIVTLTGLAPQQAVVRWGCSGAYGITFNSVLGLPFLVEWLRGQTATGRA
ncbi:MAG: PilZ domain-containing protein, partial [Sphingomonas sp.]|nr:PilZ domain-containing protein [Sphingomonas sp.]